MVDDRLNKIEESLAQMLAEKASQKAEKEKEVAVEPDAYQQTLVKADRMDQLGTSRNQKEQDKKDVMGLNKRANKNILEKPETIDVIFESKEIEHN